jgi:hydroxyacylglutathione hydrolase
VAQTESSSTAGSAEVSAQEAAATTQAEKATRVPGPGKIARAYFDAVARRDIDGMLECWAPGGIDRLAPIGPLSVPEGVRQMFGELFTAVPDMRFEVTDLVAARNQAAVRWRAVGTFCGGPFQGVEPTGARIDLEGIDLLTIEDGLIRHNEAYYDGLSFARQVGLMPPRESGAERAMTQAFNARTKMSRSLFKPNFRQVAEGVWLVQGGFPAKTMNVYLIREADGGVTVFDAGIRAMAKGIASCAAQLGTITRVVLGHGHADHRGAAPALAAPVWCHEADRADAEGDGGYHYFDFSQLERWTARTFMPMLLRSWDGGPVRIEGTVAEGDQVAGFEVIHLPGHAPGLIGLWRESDRVALVSDCFYTLDPQTGRKGHARVPHRGFNQDTEQARASIRKLAAMEPAAAWAGHADGLTSDVRAQLERAADTT